MSTSPVSRPANALDDLVPQSAMPQATPQPADGAAQVTQQGPQRNALADLAEGGGGAADQGSGEPYHIADDQRGAWNQTKQAGSNLLHLLPTLLDAFSPEAQDDDEKKTLEAGEGGTESSVPGLKLGFYRLFLKPGIKSWEVANAYQKIADEKKKLGTFDASDSFNEEHMAHVHRIAALVPMLGSVGSDITEHFAQGDPSGAVASLLANVAGGELMKGAAGKLAKKIAPGAVKIAGQEIPVTAAQQGGKAAAAAQALSKYTGMSGEKVLEQFGKKQNLAGQAAISSIADKVEAGSGSFGEAADTLRSKGATIYSRLDDLTNGKFSELRNQMKQVQSQLKQPGADLDVLNAKAKVLDGQMKDVLEDPLGVYKFKYGAEMGDEFTQAKTNFRRAFALDQVQANIEGATKEAVENINAPEKIVRGNNLLTRLNKVDPDILNRALGSSDNVSDLKQVARVLSSGENMAKAASVAKWLVATKNIGGLLAGHTGLATGTEAVSYVLAKMLTNKSIATRLINGITAGGRIQAIASSVSNNGGGGDAP